MTKKQVLILIGLALFFVALIIVGFLFRKGKISLPTGGGVRGPGGLFQPGKPGVVVNEKNEPLFSPEVSKDAKLSEPKNEAPASANPQLQTKARFFDVKVSKDGFSPQTITVNRGDTVYLDLSALDRDYDLDIPYLGAYFSVVKKGETRHLPFDVPQSGTFVFQCRDFCPPGGKIQGQLIVLP
jgi:heme/copper-type cytochrome/quinol oxidase subunit 2